MIEKRMKVRLMIIKLKLTGLAWLGVVCDKNRLFIDCGSNLGQGYMFFKKFLPPKWYDAILVEPNPNCMKVLREKFGDYSNLEFMEAAAWVRNEKLKLFGLVEDNRGETSDGASVISNHNSSMYLSNNEEALEVCTFSLSELLLHRSQEYDHIIVKLDIESAEYEVLADLLETGAAIHIKHLFVEFHSEYFKDSEKKHYQQLEVDLVEKLKCMGVGVTLWF